MRRTKLLAALAFALLYLMPGLVRGQTTPDSYKVSLHWNASDSPEVTGYRVYYGAASGAYTESIIVGNVTTAEVLGLANGAAYYFAVTAFNSSGLESEFSDEVSYMPGLHKLWIRVGGTSSTGINKVANENASAANVGPVLVVSGQIGRQYDIEASQDLQTWTIIASMTMTAEDHGWLRFSDPDAPSFLRRFYRTRETP